MFSRPSAALLLLLVLCAGLASCGDARQDPPAPKAADTFFAIRMGERTVRMQMAVLPDEVQRGLMFRQELGRDDGMLFVFSRPQPMSFWMRNTTLPLDIGYLDTQGVLREIYPMHPLDETPVTSRGREMQFALEMNQGWFRDRGVKPGDRLDLAALRAALEARGLSPEAFGLR